MCGIIGQINKKQKVDLTEFDRLRDILAHRGPDGFGTEMLNDGKVALGHRRLSIIDLTDHAKQPMCNEDQTIWLTFNGELYNFMSLKNDLIDKGHKFVSNSDTEVLIHGYEEWGIKALLKKIKGMFSFAIWDGNKKKLFAARDRFGIKPFVYYKSDNEFIFASELKAIANYTEFPKIIDANAISDFLIYSYIPFNKTVWKDTFKIPPAHYLEFDFGTFSLKTERYWNLETAENIIDDDIALGKTNELIKNATKEHLLSDVPVGLFLSGGYDSTTLLMHMTDLGYDVSSYTIGFADKEQSEHEQAKLVADSFKSNHTVSMFSRDSDVFELLREMSKFYDEPFAANSMINTYVVSELAAKTCKVVLSGEGSDEVFGGYKWHKKIDQYYENFRFKDRIKNILKGNITKKQVYLDLYNRSMSGVMGEVLNTDFINSTIKTQIRDRGLWHFEQFYHSNLDVVKRCQYIDAHSFIPDHCLFRADISSMAHSLEVRVPFLDHEIYEFVFGLNRSVYFKEGSKKFLVEENLRNRIPKEIFEMPKRGFSFHNMDSIFDSRFEKLISNGNLMKEGIITKNIDIKEMSDHFKFHLLNLELWMETHYTLN
jgi:asparagine synthase (glutamine-hydrolysing)